MTNTLSILSIIALLFLCSCKELSQVSTVDSGFSNSTFNLPYNVNSPDTSIALPGALKEISGLAFDTKRNVLLANNDEQGILFFLNIQTGKLEEALNFGKADDYEGVAFHNNEAYIVESNGNIKKVNTIKGDKIGEFSSDLSSKNNIEGICYNPISSALLLAAKGNSRIHKNKSSEKAIFEVDIKDGSVQSPPFISINLHKEVKHLSPYGIDALSKNRVKTRLKAFSPSGIAVHPKSNDLYIVSAKGNLLIVCNQSGNLQHVALLDNSLHPQAEGICFTPNGTMYISNEGKIGSGLLYRYSMK